MPHDVAVDLRRTRWKIVLPVGSLHSRATGDGTFSVGENPLGTRVVNIGNAGGGKSTLAKRLSTSKDLPLHQLDHLQWNPGWVATPKAEFDRRHNALLASDRWIIDGFASWESIEHRFESADTIVFVDHPLWVHYWWAIKRQIKCIFRPRPDFVNGCPMLPMTGTLLKMIRHIHRDSRPKLLAMIERFSTDRYIYHIRSPRELRQFVATRCH